MCIIAVIIIGHSESPSPSPAPEEPVPEPVGEEEEADPELSAEKLSWVEVVALLLLVKNIFICNHKKHLLIRRFFCL
jgi:hypothetical protein